MLTATTAAKVLLSFVLALRHSQTCYAQFYSTRNCSSSAALQAQRCLDASNDYSQFDCSAFCSSSQNTTALYAYFCTAATGRCALTSYCVTAPLLTSQTVIPTLTNLGSSVIEVPCGAAATPITGAQLGITNGGTGQTYTINRQVVASSPYDNNPNYTVALQSGVINRGSSGPAVDTTQVVSYTLSQGITGVFSNSVNITYIFRTCALTVKCPASSPTAPVIFDCSKISLGQFLPQLTCTITNAPAGTKVAWDLPPPTGQGAPTSLLTAAQNNDGNNKLFAPAIINQTLPGVAIINMIPSDQLIFIENFNNADPSGVVPTQSTAGIDPNGLTGIYGLNPTQGNVPDMGQQVCQNLRISASPLNPASTPYQTGSTTVFVCSTPC